MRASFKDQKAETAEGVTEIKNEYAAKIKQAKNEGKDPSGLISERNSKIASLKQQLAQAKVSNKEAIARAKTAYKSVASEEKAAIKGQKTDIKQVALNSKSTYKDEVLAIADKSKSKSSFSNKAEQLAFKHDIAQSKVNAKDNFKKSIILDSTKRRESFVKEYNKLAA